MSTEFDELRARIAAEHQTLVGRDDPILMLVTANDYCVQRSLQMLEAMHAQSLALQTQQLELAAQHWTTAAQAVSQQTMDQGTAAIQAAAVTAATSVQDRIEASVRALVAPLRAAIILSLCGTLLSVIACALLWLR
jgi:hypothetical protein